MGPMSRSPRVLVVEDDAEIAGALRRSLRIDGYDVRVAEDGEEALTEAGLFEPDLVVLLKTSDPRVSETADRLEAEGGEFHARVAAGYEALAEADTAHWRIVDGDGTIEEVAQRVLDTFHEWQRTSTPAS